MSTKLPWCGSWFLLSLVGRTRFFDRNISRFHFLSTFRCSCQRLQYAFLCPNWWCSGCWESSSCLGESWVPLSLLLSWIHTSFSVSVLWRLQIASRRRQISSSWSSHEHGRSGTYTFLFSFANVEFRPSVSLEEPCWTTSWTADHLALFLLSSSGSWCSRGRCCKIWVRPIFIGDWWNRKPSWNRPSLSTFWFTTHGISVQSICILQGGLLIGRIFWIQPDLLLVFGQALGIIFRTKLSRTACTTQVMSKSGGSCSHSRRHLSLVSL